MSAMPHDGNDYVNVYPGGHTACLESWSPFSFQVWPGDTDKLAIYFQAGGLCFDKRTTVERLSTGGMFERGLCTQSVGAQGARGMFNKSEKRNPWRHFTILHINYCSGDGHVGNGSRWYCEGSNCTEYQSRGYINARAAIDWVKAQMDRNLQYFSVSGSSAGAIGTYVWANPLLKEFSSDGWSYQHGSVVVDSFAAVTPEGTVAPLLKSFGLCNTSLLSEKARGACKKGGDVQLISVADSFMEGMAAYPSVWFGFISSKVDSVQKMYYQSVAVAYGKYWDAMISKQKFYRKLNTLLEDYSKHPNFVAYLIDGSQHTFLGMQYDFKYSMLCNFYKVGTTGIYEGSSGSKQGTSQLLYEWGEHFAAFNSPPKTQCSGSVVDVSEWKKKDFTDVTYCDAALLQ